MQIAVTVLALTVFVSPTGNDREPGTRDAPVRTLVRARDLLRAQKGRGSSEVVVRKGVYRVRETLALDARDSNVTWRGENGAVLDGGFAVTGFRKLGSSDAFAIQQMSPVAFSNALVADVKAAGYREWERQCRYGGAVEMSALSHRLPPERQNTRRTSVDTVFERMTDLWCNGEPMELAREPDASYLRLADVDNREVSFVTDSPLRARLAAERELMVCGFWHWNYLDETAAVDRMSPDGKVVMDDVIFRMCVHYKRMNANQPYFFVNALCALDRPGEWFLDRAEGKLYVMPKKLQKGADNKVPEQHFVLSEFKDDFVSVTNGENIVFENLAFVHGKRHGIVAAGSRAIAVRNCRLERLGGRAIVMTPVDRAVIADNFVRFMGTAGIQLESGDRVTLASGESVVRGNDVSFTSLRRRTYSPALDLDGVGTLVEKNYFHDLLSSAINLRGNDQRIYGNFIERAVLESDDQGALDTFAFISYQGNRIVGNVWKDIGGEAHDGYVAGQAGVRLDDLISAVYVASNVFINAAKGNFGAIQVNGGRANVFEDNVFVDCRSSADAAITIGVNTGWSWKHKLENSRWHSTKRWNEDMFAKPYRKYPMLCEPDVLTRFKDDNVIRRNYVTGCRDVLRRSRYDPNGYFFERDGGGNGVNVCHGAPQTELRFLSDDGKVEAAVRYDRKNGAKVRIFRRTTGVSEGGGRN